MSNPFDPRPFQPNPFGAGQPGPQTQPAPPPPRDEANALATLSVVFAFVFAPAGLILGHLGLAQIRRTGERGRDRALVGVTLSYVFITALVVALIVRATLSDPGPSHVAAPTTTTTTARTTTSTTTTPPPPPTVAPADLDGLLPSLDDVEDITTDHAMKVQRTLHQPAPDPARGDIDRPDCWPVFESSAPEAYDGSSFTGFSATEILDTNHLNSQWTTGQGVTAFRDAATAQAPLEKLLSTFRRCGGSTLHATWPNGKTYPVAIGPPADAGNGITAIDLVPQTPIPITCVHAVAAKANVIVDVETCFSGKTDASRQATLTITNYILRKIPG